ncbi:F-box protein CPR1-like [Mercurialis annua]|uniref:F-box protein CPR1-like n=1 Tax=Mercurialis annua TaxID=3986 RepID=UPI00215F7FC5|nr:F-box protein CPR1-like [Mercurialis annua]
MIGNLPEELKAEILKRVPNEDLLRCSAVCKSLYSLLKSPSFIFDTHLRHLQASNSNPHLVIMDLRLGNGNYEMSFHDDNTEQFTECHLPPHFYSMSELCTVASCNGLLLFRPYSQYILHNPSICRSLRLPKQKLDGPSGCELCGLGFDSTTNDFKVLRLLCRSVVVQAEVYSVNAASWRNITHITPQYEIPYHNIFKPQCIPFVNGALHMIVGDCSSNDKGRSLVLVFDVKDEIFREILLPPCLMNVSPVMLFVIAYRQSIAVVHIFDTNTDTNTAIRIWVMKEYGVFDSWTNLANMFNVETIPAAFFLRKNGQLMIDSGVGHFLSYDFATQRFHNLFTDLDAFSYMSAFTYVESLALFDTGNLIVE